MITTGSTVQQHLLGARDPHLPQTEGPVDSLQRSEEVSTMADPGAAPVQRAIAFGPFQLLPAQRLLLEAGQPVRIGSRAPWSFCSRWWSALASWSARIS
jgi:hypothetical protein